MDKKKSLALPDYYAEVGREIQGLDATFLDFWKQARTTSFLKSRQE